MNSSTKIRAAGIAGGLAIFVAVGLFVTVAADKSRPNKAPLPGAVAESVVAPAEQLGKAFAAVAAHVKPAVVSVYSEKTVRFQSQDFPFPFSDDIFGQLFGRQTPQPKSRNQPKEYRVPQRGMGSGMILDKQGHILTNYHVVNEVDEIKVLLADKRTLPAEIVGTDPKTDMAVIRIKGSIPNDLPTVQLGDSDALEDGHLVMAIGAPFGLTQTVTTGIISAKGRSDVGIAYFEDFLQTDAPINPGNSGGPLVNMRGEVIGMNSAIATGGGQFGGEGQSAGVGFAIPSNMIKAMLPTLIKGGQINRGMLGVIIQDISEDLARQFHLSDTKGTLVSQVNKDSPAEIAGLKSGDVIVRFGGKEVSDTRHLRNMVAATTPGSTVKVDVIRNGKAVTFAVTIGKLTSETTAAAKPSSAGADRLAKFGLSVRTLTPELAQQFGLEDNQGVLVTDVNYGSPAAVANLQPGDLVVEADRKRVNDIADLQSAFASAKDQILLLIKRKGASLYVVFRLK